MFNLAIYMYTSEIITTSMLLLYTHLRNVAFDTNSRRWRNCSKLQCQPNNDFSCVIKP